MDWRVGKAQRAQHLRWWPWVQRAPGLPCALDFRGWRVAAKVRPQSFSWPILRDAAFAAPQDEVVMCGLLSTLMVRSAARPRVSNHKAPLVRRVRTDLNRFARIGH